MALLSGTSLGPYEILASLGAGGMGEVYRARDVRLGREVAVKVLRTHLSSNPELRQRFQLEARAISSLSHPHICTLHDVGCQDGIDFLVMEYLEGETLAERLRTGPLQLQQALSASSLTMSVSAPSASITEQGMIVGTFRYMAPELLQCKEADVRSDIFSFGCVLYEMLTGRRPFEGQSERSVLRAILETEPEPITNSKPLTPPLLEHSIRRCLTKDPDERW